MFPKVYRPLMKNSWHARGWEHVQSIGNPAGAGALDLSLLGVAKGRAGREHQSDFAFISGFWPRILGQEGHTQQKAEPFSRGGGVERQDLEGLRPTSGMPSGWLVLSREDGHLYHKPNFNFLRGILDPPGSS